MKTTIFATAILALASTEVSVVRAAIVAMDSFNTPATGALDGQGRGPGWIGNWITQIGVNVSPGGLSYSNGGIHIDGRSQKLELNSPANGTSGLTFNEPDNYFIDELRIGTTWNDIVASIPEPSGILLLAIGVVAASCHRRKQRPRCCCQWEVQAFTAISMSERVHRKWLVDVKVGHALVIILATYLTSLGTNSQAAIVFQDFSSTSGLKLNGDTSTIDNKHNLFGLKLLSFHSTLIFRAF